MSPQSVFVSHSSKDDATVRQIRQSLHIPVWTDSEYLSPGDPRTPKITQAIETATHFLVITGLEALNSPWVTQKIHHAQQVQKSKGQPYIGRDDDEVYVIGHQGKGQDEEVFCGGVDAKLFELDAAVAAAVEDALAARTALGDVVPGRTHRAQRGM